MQIKQPTPVFTFAMSTADRACAAASEVSDRYIGNVYVVQTAPHDFAGFIGDRPMLQGVVVAIYNAGVSISK